ncbi:MAG: hypothetical protein JXD22_11710 [Sedimentisphaerales bacterium]|nr:hypothetical protein [Sedimentisphaerales bacterium]
MDYSEQRKYLADQLSNENPEEHLVAAIELIDCLLLEQDKKTPASNITAKMIGDSLDALSTMKQACDKAQMCRADHGIIDNCVACLRKAIDELKKCSG